MAKKSISKSNSKSKRKSASSVKSKTVPRSVAKKSATAKRVKVAAQKSFSLPTTAQLPSVGELPELPNFDDFAQAVSQPNQPDVSTPDLNAMSSQVSSTTSQPSAEEKPKLWWLSWLLPGKKQQVIDAHSVDVTALEAADKLTPEESAELAKMPSQEEVTDVLSADTKALVSNSKESKKSKKASKKHADAKTSQTTTPIITEDHVARAYDEVETLKARLDDEMRERQSVVDASHERVKVKEVELEKWHADLLNREKEVVKKEKEYERIKKLESQVEDKEITLKYKEDEIEDLKNKLAEKELELTQQEARLKEMASRLEKIKTEKQAQSVQTTHVSDDYHKLAKKQGHVVHHKVEPKAVLSKVVSSINVPSKREIRNLLLKAYDQLSTGDMTGLQVTYNKIRDLYAAMITTTGPDEQLYQDILDLYNDIKLAVMQRS